ncbi:hypothetical protein X801_04941 [Opisthorchis viverrini]|uniref:Uncharacterized protein n=1 Tax=Opisthorchis viverrini TaxID=6198 RepID=A0A1S8WY77_OPIVI|nr:hypothetical protein X801_04941 [Opisthorchis viverrini]
MENHFGIVTLGNPQLDSLRSDQAGLNSKEVIHNSKESSLNEETQSHGVANTDVHNADLEDEEHTAEANDPASKLSAHFFAGSQGKTKFSPPKPDASNLQSISTRHTKNSAEPAIGWKRSFRKPRKRTQADGLSKPTLKCPCTYKELRVIMNVLEKAEYVLEDTLLFLKRTRGLEKTISNLLDSMDRTLRGTCLHV